MISVRRPRNRHRAFGRACARLALVVGPLAMLGQSLTVRNVTPFHPLTSCTG